MRAGVARGRESDMTEVMTGQDRERVRQELAGQLVAQEVCANVGRLIDRLLRSGDYEAAEDYYYSAPPDWDAVIEACEDAGYTVIHLTDAGAWRTRAGGVVTWDERGPAGTAGLEPGWYCVGVRGAQVEADTVDESLCAEDIHDAIREVADEAGVDLHDHQREIYEWWIVSPWLARRLREHGEHVVDVDGVECWGRTCTGQALKLDSVICEIAAAHYGDAWPRGDA